MFEIAGELVGVGEIESAVEGDGNSIEVVAVKPVCQGGGLGSYITRYCMNKLLQQGVSPVYVAVLDNNYPARRLYEKLGCRRVAVYEEAVWRRGSIA